MNEKDKQIGETQFAALFSGRIPYRDEMAYYLDENVDVNIARILRSEGKRATTIYDEGQTGEPADTLILAHARALGCTLVTIDRHFEEIHERVLGGKNLSHAGIILLSKNAQQSAERTAGLLARLCEKFEGFPDWIENAIYSL